MDTKEGVNDISLQSLRVDLKTKEARLAADRRAYGLVREELDKIDDFDKQAKAFLNASEFKKDMAAELLDIKKIADKIQNNVSLLSEEERYLTGARLEKTKDESGEWSPIKQSIAFGIPISEPTYAGNAFGKSDEKTRRQNLSDAVRQFNERVALMHNKLGKDRVRIWLEYENRYLLDDGVIKDFQFQSGVDYQDYLYNRDLYARKNKDPNIEPMRKFAVQYEADEKWVADAKKKLAQQQKGAGELTPVTDDMSPEDKRRVRAENLDKLKGLQDVSEADKPALNMAGMMSNLGNDR